MSGTKEPTTNKPIIKTVLTFLGIVVALIACRWPILFSPPYWDAALGLWAEADTLVRKDFNLAQHWFVEPHGLVGGTAFYRFTWLPPFLAFVMKYSPDADFTILFYRILTFSWTAIIAMLLYQLVRRPGSPTTALLTTVAALTSPILCTQIDMLAMEIPLAVASVGVARLVAVHRYVMATIVAVAGFLTKPSMLILLLALVAQTTLVLLFADRTNRGLRWQAGRGLFLATFAVVMGYGMHSGDLGPASSFTFAMPLVMSLWFPDLMILAVVGILGAGLGLLLPWGRPVWDEAVKPRTFAQRCLAKPEITFAVIAVAGGLASFVFVRALPRYVTFLVPLIFLLVTFATQRLSVRWATHPLLVLVLAFNLLNWNGSLYPSPSLIARIMHDRWTDALNRDGAILERTHAYLADHRSNIDALRKLEAAWDGAPVFTGYPFVAMLSAPRLGYVDEAISGYMTNGFHTKWNSFGDVAQTVVEPPPAAWFIYSRNSLEQHWARFHIPPPEEDDEILYDDGGPPPLVVYRKRMSTSEIVPGLTNWYFKQLGPSPDTLPHRPPLFRDRTVSVMEALGRLDRPDLMAEFMDSEKPPTPSRPNLRLR